MFKRNDEKKRGNHIRTKMNFVRSLTRNSLRISVFIFSLHFSIKTINKILQCLSWKCCVFLGPNIDRHENTSIASSRISTSFLINFSVIFRMSSQTLLSKKQSLNLRTFCVINFLAIPTFSKINYRNTSEIFQSIICLKWQINSTIYANVAF